MPVSSYITPKARKGTASAIEGRGLIAVAPIAAGELVAIKGGHIITTAALHSLPERLRNSEIQIADGFHLAALEEAEYEPVMLFLNHSCEPNVGFAGNTVLVAMRDIAPGEELTTDYALFDDNDETMRCRCGSRSCRGTISGRDWQRPDLQRKYGDYFSTYLLRRFAIRPDPGSPPGGGLLSPPSLVAKAAAARPSCTCGSDASRRGRTPESTRPRRCATIAAWARPAGRMAWASRSPRPWRPSTSR